MRRVHSSSQNRPSRTSHATRMIARLRRDIRKHSSALIPPPPPQDTALFTRRGLVIIRAARFERECSDVRRHMCHHIYLSKSATRIKRYTKKIIFLEIITHYQLARLIEATLNNCNIWLILNLDFVFSRSTHRVLSY